MLKAVNNDSNSADRSLSNITCNIQVKYTSINRVSINRSIKILMILTNSVSKNQLFSHILLQTFEHDLSSRKI